MFLAVNIVTSSPLASLFLSLFKPSKASGFIT